MKLPHCNMLGHRQRLREKLATHGIDALQEYEILELILFSSVPVKNVQPLAKTLMDKFGTLQNLLHATAEDFATIADLNDDTIEVLTDLAEIHHKMAPAYEPPKALYRAELAKKFLLSLQDKHHECLAYMAFDKNLNLVCSDEITQLDTHQTIIDDRDKIIRRAKEYGAQYLYLAHNHPDDLPISSLADRNYTDYLLQKCTADKIVLLDHAIVSKAGIYSFFFSGELGDTMAEFFIDDNDDMPFSFETMQELYCFDGKANEKKKINKTQLQNQLFALFYKPMTLKELEEIIKAKLSPILPNKKIIFK